MQIYQVDTVQGIYFFETIDEMLKRGGAERWPALDSDIKVRSGLDKPAARDPKSTTLRPAEALFHATTMSE